jgi:Protein of unknown function (DUF1559)
MRLLACSLLLVVPLLSLLPAAEPAATSRAAALAPWIDEDAFAVVRLDAAKVDVDLLARQLKSADADAANRIDNIAAGFKKWLSSFTSAGGTEIVVVFSAADIPRASLAVVPLKDGANEAALKRVVHEAFDYSWRAEKTGQALVAGEPAALARLASGKPSARAELVPAVEAAGDGWLQVLLVPTEDQRRVIEEVLPLTPGFAGISGKELRQGLRWAALGLDTAPKPLLRLSVQSADNASARSVAALSQQALAALGRRVLFGEEKPLSELMPGTFNAAAAALTPAVNGDRLSVTFADADAAKNVLAVAAFAAGRYDEFLSQVRVTNVIKQIVLAFHNYSSANKTFPPTAIRSKDGRPLLSWRVAILPYVEQENLYRQFHLDEPWDSEHNKQLIEKMPAIYRSPRSKDKRAGFTTFLAPVGPGLAFSGDAVGRQFKEFTDGTANTIMLVDAADEAAVIWTKPDDLVVDLNEPKKGLLRESPARLLFGMADGTFVAVPRTVSNATLRSAFTVAGGEVLGSDW